MHNWIILFCLFLKVNAVVEQITMDNFESIKNNSKYLLINFYETNDTLADMMLNLSESRLKKITYASSDDKDLAEKLDVPTYPKLKWFMQGDEYEFRGEYTYDKVFKLLVSATSNWATPLESQEHLDKFLTLPKNYAVAVSNDAEVDLKSLAILLPYLSIGHLRKNGKDLFPPGTLRIYNTFSETLQYDEFNEDDNVLEWIYNVTTPKILSPRWPIFNIIYKYTNFHMLFFGGINATIIELAEKYSPKVLFVEVDKNMSTLYEKFNVSEGNSTVVFVNRKSRVKFKKLALDSVEKFIKTKLVRGKKKNTKRKKKNVTKPHDEL